MSTSAVFVALPGVETPIADLQHTLAEIWDPAPGAGSPKGEPGEFRASQMNLVLHFGLDAQPDEARAGFDVAINFSRRYPCRIIALCPRPEGGAGRELQAKIFCECFVGSSRDDMTCTEAIILTYPLEQRAYLEDQASILLESDLPIFYWPQHINRASRLSDYRYFLKHSQRIVIDSAVEKADVANYTWPRPEIVHDLAWGRILPIRQNIGHFLSYIEPQRLVRDLQRVELRHRPAFAAEGRALQAWMQRGIEACARQAKLDVAPEYQIRADDHLAGSLAVVWSHGEHGRLTFSFDFEHATASLESTLDCEPNVVSATARLLPPEKALAEVLFF